MAQYENMFGGGGYRPPAPKCKSFKCAKGEKAIRKKGYKTWSYGCKDAGANFMTMDNFDPNDPLGGMKNKKDFDKCCLEHDACLQTCGMSAKACHEAWQKCSDKVCKNDRNCGWQAELAKIMAEPHDILDKAEPRSDGDPVTDRQCRLYDKMQQEGCECVAEDEWTSTLEKRMKTFYKLYNPEKLVDGEIKDLEQVKNKWAGKYPEMFLELTKKYKDKAIERRTKPKPDYSAPKGDSDTDAGSETPETADAADAEDTAEGVPETGKFEDELASLQESKAKAVSEEDFERAQQVADEIKALKSKEIARLKEEKSLAVEAEDYMKAKELKKRIDSLSEAPAPKQEL